MSAPGASTSVRADQSLASLRWLSRDLASKADRMQRSFPEGRLFTVALTGMGWAEVGARDPALAAEALSSARITLALARDPETSDRFPTAGGLPHGMFYEAWTTRLGVSVARLERSLGEPPDTTALAASCRRLNAVLTAGPVFVESYSGLAWPADTVVGAAALAGCGDVLETSDRQTARAWVQRASAFVDPATGLLSHSAMGSGSRGSSTALMIPFLAEIDTSYAESQYARFIQSFPTRVAGIFPAVREYPNGSAGPGDIDSGPILLGVSAPATVVGIAAARSVGDLDTADALYASTEMVGVPTEWGGRRRYGFGALPVGDAFRAWASGVPTIAMGAQVTSPFVGWRLRARAGCMLAFILGILACARLVQTRKR